jgi:hypothetical protein
VQTDRFCHAKSDQECHFAEGTLRAHPIARTARSSRTGQPCKKAAITGMRVCRTHGGAAPQVREAARLRLALLADPAVRRLAKIRIWRRTTDS